MAERRRLGYNVHRDVMDEEEVEELAEKSEVKTSLARKLKKSVR